jgi:hypothetical protein
MLTEILRYAWALLNNWAGYTTGGLITAVVATWLAWKERKMTHKILICLSALFFIMAGFKAWEDVREKQRAAETEAERQFRQAEYNQRRIDQIQDAFLIASNKWVGETTLAFSVDVKGDNDGNIANIQNSPGAKLTQTVNPLPKPYVYTHKLSSSIALAGGGAYKTQFEVGVAYGHKVLRWTVRHHVQVLSDPAIEDKGTDTVFLSNGTMVPVEQFLFTILTARQAAESDFDFLVELPKE